MEDFNIKDGVLISYRGKSEYIVIPNGVTSIGYNAFHYCNRLTNVTLSKGVTIVLPEGVKNIGEYAFSQCENLTSINFPDSLRNIGEGAFSQCGGLKNIVLPEHLGSIGAGAFSCCCDLESITIPDSVKKIGKRAFDLCYGLADENNLIIVRDVLYGIGRQDVKHITIPNGVTTIEDQAFYGYTDRLTDITIPEGINSIGEQAFQACKHLKNINIPDSAVRIGRNVFMECSDLKNIMISDGPKHILKGAFDGCENLETITFSNSRAGERMPEFLVKAFEKCRHLKAIIPIKPKLAIKNADMAALEEVITKIKTLEKDTKHGKWEALRLSGEVLHSDLPLAMRFAEKRGLLDEYAKLHGTTADELREQNMSSFGLDENGECRLNLAGRDIIVKLDAELKLTLTDTKSGKAIKSIPKKGADPLEYETVCAAFKEMKQGIAEMTKLWGNKLFEEFLLGYERESLRWQKLFLNNPMMRAIGRLLVWVQDRTTFTLHDDGKAYTVDGSAYTLSDSDIKLAHPMEMDKGNIKAWQDYFMVHQLKQPFEQVWEPVVDASLVKPGRYDGCTIELYHLMNKEKHGITLKGQDEIELKDCSAQLKFKEGHHDWIHNLYEVKKFRYKVYNRQVNHIVTLLDKGTVAGRILKDDVTVAQWLDYFTLAQITEFIDMAAKAEAHNVTALLLDYKQKNYPDTDAFAEFTLDW